MPRSLRSKAAASECSQLELAKRSAKKAAPRTNPFFPATMSAAVYEVEVGGVGAGAAAPALRTSLEGSKDAFHIAAVHWVAVAFTIRPAAHGLVEVSPILFMWLVLRILIPAEDPKQAGSALLGHYAAAPLPAVLDFWQLVEVAGLAPKQYASKEHAAYAIYLARDKLTSVDLELGIADVIVLSAPATNTFLDHAAGLDTRPVAHNRCSNLAPRFSKLGFSSGNEKAASAWKTKNKSKCNLIK